FGINKMKIKFIVRQMIKMAVQNVLLPFVYRIHRRKTVNKRMLLFADAHHDTIPYSMEAVRQRFDGCEWEIREYFLDYQGNSFFAVLRSMLAFMRDYANAGYVFICDNFLPVSSCRKRPETCVVQLWHAGGILKKYAYDTPDDIPAYYKGHVYKNYDVVTVSAPVCVPVYERAMRLRRETIYPIGLSRTDCFFDENYLQSCREEFYAHYPEAKGKRILLFAPTFRGKASDPYLVGGEWVMRLEEQLNGALDEGEMPYKVYMRVHPHLDNKKKLSNIDMETQKLLPVVDLLISDVSSVIFDYVLLQKPMVLFLPDLEELESTRGFYIPLADIPGTLVTQGEKLAGSVRDTVRAFYAADKGGQACDDDARQRLRNFCRLYMGSCDGQATDRLLSLIGLLDKR
ncbi:MAG: CDP-glycerol glycerophosphotransferase family protein, partial [Lachnospiraceae bacterium]|nr:CDP-glycerol glycerophosphotransferase family protein [Lachnospiraceae bacterium]